MMLALMYTFNMLTILLVSIFSMTLIMWIVWNTMVKPEEIYPEAHKLPDHRFITAVIDNDMRPSLDFVGDTRMKELIQQYGKEILVIDFV